MAVWDQFIKKASYDYEYNFDGYKEKIELLKQLKRFDQIEQVYDDYLRENPNSFEIYKQKAQFLKDQGKFERSLAVFDQIILTNRDDFDSYKQKAQFLKDQGKFESSLKVWDQFISNNYKDFKGYKEKARIYKELKQNDESDLVYQEYIFINNSNFTAIHEKTQILKGEGRLEDCVEMWNNFISKYPRDPDGKNSYKERINLLKELKKFNEVQEAYSEYLLQYPVIDHIFFKEYTSFLNSQGNFSEIIAFCDKYQKTFVNNYDFYLILSQAYVDQRKVNEALFNINKAITLCPTSPEAYNAKGKLLQLTGDLPLAYQAFKQAVLFNPTYSEGYYNKAELGLLLNKPDSMINWAYEQAILFKYNYSEAYNGQGKILVKMGRIEEAEKAFGKAIDFKPEYIDAYYNIGNILEGKKKINEALEIYLKALKINSEKLEIFSRIERILRIQKKKEEIKHIEKITELQKKFIEIEKFINENHMKNFKFIEIGDYFKELNKKKHDFIDILIYVLKTPEKSNEKLIFSDSFFNEIGKMQQELLSLKEKISILKKAENIPKIEISNEIKQQSNFELEIIRKEFEQLEAKSKELFTYCKVFYSLALNYLGASMDFSNSLKKHDIQVKYRREYEIQLKGAHELAVFGAKITKTKTFFSSRQIGFFDKIVGFVSEAVKQNRVDNRIIVRSKIIREKFKFNKKEEIIIALGRIALNFTRFNEENILLMKKQKQSEWFDDEIEGLSKEILAKFIEDNENLQNGSMALIDFVLVIAYLMKNYREVLGLEESIVKQCENIAKNGGLTGLSWRGKKKYLLHPETHKLILIN